jgi:PadR family transcriptional regulator, regulatory protein PadR
MDEGQHLAEFELLLMLAVMRLGETGYGAALRREIEERTSRPVSIGAVYATLGRLEEKGLIVSRVSEPEPVRGGRSRRQVRLTPLGRRSVERSIGLLARMTAGLSLDWEVSGG